MLKIFISLSFVMLFNQAQAQDIYSFRIYNSFEGKYGDFNSYSTGGKKNENVQKIRCGYDVYDDRGIHPSRTSKNIYYTTSQGEDYVFEFKNLDDCNAVLSCIDTLGEAKSSYYIRIDVDQNTKKITNYRLSQLCTNWD